MSLASMTNIAYHRRADVRADAAELAAPTRGVDSVARAKNEEPEAQSPTTSALAALSAYVPTELIALYLSVLGASGIAAAVAAGTPSPVDARGIFYGFLIAAPVVVWLIFAGKVRAAGKKIPTDIMKWPKFEMFAAFVAFGAWALAVPGNAFTREAWYNAGLIGSAALIVSAALGLLATIFTADLKGD